VKSVGPPRGEFAGASSSPRQVTHLKTILLLFIRAQGICPRCTAAVETYCATLVFLNVPTFAASPPPRPCYPRGPWLRKVELLGRQTWPTILPRMHDFHGTFRDLLHAANLRHGSDGFTSPPKEGVLRIFSP